jgi:protein CMS1
VAEQQKLLEGAAVGVASGTPNRLCKLADLGALKTDHLQLLVLDVHLDAKQR